MKTAVHFLRCTFGCVFAAAIIVRHVVLAQAPAKMTEAEFNGRFEALRAKAAEQTNAGDLTAAVKTYKEAIGLADTVYGPANVWTAVAGFWIAGCDVPLGNFDEGLRLLDTSLPIFERTYGRENEMFVNMLQLRGLLRSQASRPAEGIPDLEASLAIAQKICPPGHPIFSAGLKLLAHAHMLMRDYDLAETEVRQAIAHIEKHDPQNKAALASTRCVLDDLLLQQGRWTEARVVQEQILPEFKASTNLLPYNLGNLYGSMIDTLVNLADWPAADALIREALQYVERHSATPEEWQSGVLGKVALRESKWPDVAAARTSYTRALDIARKVEETVKFAPLNPLAGLGWCHEEDGDLAKAEETYRNALNTATALGDSEKAFQASMEMNLGRIGLAMRDVARAEPHARRSVELYREVYSTPNPALIAPLEMAGNVTYQIGRTAEALKFLSEAVALAEGFFERSPENSLMALDTMSYVLRKEGRNEEALEHQERATKCATKFGITTGMRIAELHAGRSHLLRGLGRYDEALAAATEAMRAAESVQTGSAATMHQHFKNLLALSTWNTGQHEKARALVRETLPPLLEQFHTMLATSSEEQRHALAANAGIQDMSANFGMAGETATIVASTKGAVMESIMAQRRAAALANDDPRIKAMRDELEAARLDLSAAMKPGAGRSTDAARIQALQENVERREQTLANALGRERQAVVTTAEIAKNLPPDSALLDWFRYRRHRQGQSSDISYGLVLYRPGKTPTLHTIGTAAELLSAIATLHQEANANANTQTLNAGRTLLDLVLGDAAPELTGVKTLYLCPDDALHLVPFAVLPDAEGKLFGERFAIRRLSSAREVMHASAKLGAKARIEVLTAPQFSLRPIGSSDPRVFKDLPGSLRTANSIAQIVRKTGHDCTVRTGADATESAVRGLRDPGVLHLDTHGYYSAAPVEDLPDPFAYRRNDVVISRREVPMERSGIALAGAEDALRSAAQATPGTTRADGMLMAAEAAELHLDKTWLVIVNACSSARGTLRSGDGVASVQRGFQLAGAAHVIATLWSVFDQSSADFMEDFYPRMLRSGDAAQSLLDTQMAQFRRIEKKSGWAKAFVITGSWILVSHGR